MDNNIQSYGDVRDMRNKAADIIMKACISYVVKDDPTLAGDQAAWQTAAKSLYDSLNWSSSFLRMEVSIPNGAPAAPTTFTWNPLNSAQSNQGRAAAVTYTQDDAFLGFSEMVTWDSRVIGADAAADYQSFANPLHFLAIGAVYAGAPTDLPPLNAIYNGQEVIKVVNVDYRTNGSTWAYKQIPRISQTLTAGAATGNYSFTPPFVPVQSDSVVVLSGQKKTEYKLTVLNNPAIVVPITAGTELVCSKWVFGYIIPQGKSLYEALNGVII